jgi:hypothetical protein
MDEMNLNLVVLYALLISSILWLVISEGSNWILWIAAIPLMIFAIAMEHIIGYARRKGRK